MLSGFFEGGGVLVTNTSLIHKDNPTRPSHVRMQRRGRTPPLKVTVMAGQNRPF
jgi:hypothetical protein